MKNIIPVLMLLIFACEEPSTNFELKEITVYSISFGINFPVDMGDEAVRSVPTYVINDQTTLNKIEKYIKDLTKAKDGYKSNEIYLRSELLASDDEIQIMEYNKNSIRLDGFWYNHDPEL